MILSGLNYTNPDCIYEKYMGFKGNKSGICLEFPGYASNILIELHENNQKYEVKIRYNGHYLPMCGDLTSQTCSYETFRNKLMEFVVKDFPKQCKKDIGMINKTLENEQKNSSLERNSVAKVFAFLFGLILGVSIVGGVVYYKFYKQNTDSPTKESGYFEF
jgi:hypothetical protein